MNQDEKSDIFNLFLVYLIIVLLVPIMMAIDYFIINRFKAFHIIMNFQKILSDFERKFCHERVSKLNEQEMKQLIGGYSSKDCLKRHW